MLATIWIWFFGYCIGCTNAPANKAMQKDTIPVKAVATRPVADKFAWQPVVQDSTKKYIYLSFDDGPQPGTLICFDLVKKENIKASFFMVGLHAEKRKDGKEIVAMIRDAYPQILLANHSYTHANDQYIYFYQHPEMAEQDFYAAQDSLHVPFKIARLPGNSAWVRDGDIKATHLVRPLAELLDSAGYNLIGWDVEWRFNHKNARPIQTPAKLVAEVDSAFARNHTHVKNNLVILSHDRMFKRPADADSLARFIQLLKQNPNYILETADHYPALKKLTH